MSSELMSSLRGELLQLDKQREELRTQIQEAIAYLDTTPVGLNGPLIDNEGFPRDDCDLYAIRQARQKVNCGKNDLKEIEVNMYEKLALLHAENNKEKVENEVKVEKKTQQKEDITSIKSDHRIRLVREMSMKTPFVRVMYTTAGSPGERAGLVSGDDIIQYGDIDAAVVERCGFGEMSRVTSVHEGQMLSVWVKRQNEVMELFLVPQIWEGDGLVGCGFEPILHT